MFKKKRVWWWQKNGNAVNKQNVWTICTLTILDYWPQIKPWTIRLVFQGLGAALSSISPTITPPSAEITVVFGCQSSHYENISGCRGKHCMQDSERFLFFFGGGRGGLSAVVLLGGAVSCQTVVHSPLSTRVRRAASICTMITTLHSQQHIPSGPSGELELFSTMAAIISANDWNMSSWGNICCYLRPWQNRGSGRRHGTQ